jgi:23S rRNA (cytosine1962-C5)-methyltransferase
MAFASKNDINELGTRFGVALEQRARTVEDTEAYRWVDDAADGFPGVTVDRYGQWAVLSILDDRAAETVATQAEVLLRFVRGVYVKRRPRADLRHEDRAALAPEKPFGEPAPGDLVVRVRGASFHVALDDGLSTGLFNDQRDNWALVESLAEGKRVLNLFAYTCAFTVAAAQGRALETVSVDLSKRALSRGAKNLELNGVAGPAHRLLPADAFDWLARAERKAQRFDLVVLDPPSFGTRRRGTFSVERDYSKLAASALSLLSPGGALLAVTNHQKTTTHAFHAMLRDAARESNRAVAELRPLPTPEDHRFRLDGEPRMKSALARVC